MCPLFSFSDLERCSDGPATDFGGRWVGSSFGSRHGGAGLWGQTMGFCEGLHSPASIPGPEGAGHAIANKNPPPISREMVE